MVYIANVPNEAFVGAYCIKESGTILAYRHEDGHTFLYEYEKPGRQLCRVPSSVHPKPDHWKPALRFFGIR